MSGAVAYRTGLAAEDAVARRYESEGHRIRARRWRGRGGEIDLVFQSGDELVFVEVKAGRSLDRALQQLSPRQVSRICAAASEFVANEPFGQDTPMRVDLAVVDRSGGLDVVRNILM